MIIGRSANARFGFPGPRLFGRGDEVLDAANRGAGPPTLTLPLKGGGEN